jgi:hypothetical protein
MMQVSPVREPLINGEKSYNDITNDVMAPIHAKPGKVWYMGLTVSIIVMLVGFAMMGYTYGSELEPGESTVPLDGG